MRHTAIATLALAGIGLVAGGGSGYAQSAPALDNPQVEIAYVEPSNAAHRPIYDRLKQRKVLEELKQFLAPLRFPANRKLTVKLATCGENSIGSRYEDGVITICYEHIERIRKLAPSGTTPEGWKAEDAIVGPFIEVVFNGVALAAFDLLDVPVWGRELDAADNLGAFIMWQFGKDVARRTLTGVAHFHQAQAIEREAMKKEHFADPYGTDWQRFYSFLCIAYGGAVASGEQDTFKDSGAEIAAPEVPKRAVPRRVPAGRICLSEAHPPACRSATDAAGPGEAVAAPGGRQVSPGARCDVMPLAFPLRGCLRASTGEFR